MSALDRSTVPLHPPGDRSCAAAPVIALQHWNPTAAAPLFDDDFEPGDGDPAGISYEIDAFGSLRFVSDGWDLFALANGAPRLRRRSVLGQNFWDAFADEATREEHEAILERCRTRGQMGTFLFRCDAPFERRLLRMQIRPMPDGGFRFDSHTIATQKRHDGVYEKVMRMAPAPGVARCSHCNRFRFDRDWMEPEQVRHVEFEQEPGTDRSRMIHTLCPSCRASMRGVPKLVEQPT